MSPEQLARLDAEGIVVPARVPRPCGGLQRAYSPEQMTELSVIACLRRKRVSLQSIRELLVDIRLALRTKPAWMVVTHESAIGCKDPTEVFRVICRARRHVYVVEVEYF